MSFAARQLSSIGFKGPSVLDYIGSSYFEFYYTTTYSSSAAGTASPILNVNGCLGFYVKDAVCAYLRQGESGVTVGIPIDSMPGGVDAGENFFKTMTFNSVGVDTNVSYPSSGATSNLSTASTGRAFRYWNFPNNYDLTKPLLVSFS